MPIPFGATTKGKITRYLRQHPGARVTVALLAAQFRTSPGNVRELIGQIRHTFKGWEVKEEREGRTKVYTIWPPGSKFAGE